MREAFKPLDAKGLCFLVLTLDRYGTYSGEPWGSCKDAYQQLGKLTSELLKRLRKWAKRNGWTPLRNQWVATVEMHRSGWPHMNLLIWYPELADWLRDESKAKQADGMTESEARFVSRDLADMVTGCGWGLLSTAEVARSKDAAMGYLTKLAGKVDESLGELAKVTQLPTKAPERFRRIRSGVGFLPPRQKSETLTGTLLRRQVSNDGTRDVIPLHDVAEQYVKPSEECCATEEQVWIQEEIDALRCDRQVKRFGRSVVELPPVTSWIRKTRLDRGAPPRNEQHANDNDNPAPGRPDQTNRTLQARTVLHATAGPV